MNEEPLALQRLSERVACMERQSRCLKLVGAAVLVILGLAFVMGQATEQTRTSDVPWEIRAKQFVVVDEDGDSRASLGFAPGAAVHGRSVPGFESAVLDLEAKDNKSGVSFLVMHDGMPGIMFKGKDGRTRITMRLLPDDSPVVWFIDNENRDRVKMYLEDDGTPMLVLKGEDGKPVYRAP